MLLSQEHYDLMDMFEREHRGLRLDREKDKALWAKGHVYENGQVNELFIAYRKGYMLGKFASDRNAKEESIACAISK